MKTCPKCGAQVADDAAFCTVCGFNFNEAAGAAAGAAAQGAPQGAPQPQYQQPQYQQAPVAPSHPLYAPVNPCDKVLGIVAVMFGFIGVIIAYFGGDVNGQRSEYLRFYANEGLVLALFYLIAGLIPFVGWFVLSIFNLVCTIIAIVYACKGQTKPVLFYGTLRLIK